MSFGNAKQLLQRLGVCLDSHPDDLDTREARIDQLNRRYVDLSVEENWLALQTEVDWPIYCDVTGSTVRDANGDLVPSIATFTAGSHAVTFTAGPRFGAGAIAQAGQQIEDADGAIYTIARFTDQLTCYITERYGFATNSTLDWRIRMRHFRLPVDCSKALGFIDRVEGIGRMVVLDRRTEETYLSTQTDTTGTLQWVVDDDAEYDRAPDAGWTLTDNTGGGTLPANSIWEVTYTFDSQGRESPPSPPVRITLGSGAAHRIVVAGMEDVRDGTLPTGIYRNVYARQISSGVSATGAPVFVFGRWLFHSQITDPSITTVTIAAISELDRSATTELRFQNGRKWMRPKWVPAVDQTLRLRYLRYPRALVADSDVPWFPEAFHDLLVLGAAIDAAAQYGMMAKVPGWEREYKSKLARMKATGLALPDLDIRKARFDRGGGGGPYRVGSGVTTDFTG